MFFFPPNWAKECGQAAIIFFQITSWTFSLICFNIINSPVLRGRSKFSSLHADKCTHIMWPTFSYASGCTFSLSLINILISNYQIIIIKSELGKISYTCTDTETDRHARGKGERALWSSVTSISHLVPYLQNLVCCLRDILHKQCQSKGKDSMGCLGQGQVSPCFYFGRTDDLFKPSNPRDFNIHNIPASGGAHSRPPVHVYAGVLYTFYHADAECARTCTSVGTVDISVCSCSSLCTNSPCCSSENCTSSPLSVNQLWVKPRKHLKEQSADVTVTVFHPSWQFLYFKGMMRRGSGWPESAWSPTAIRGRCWLF